MSVHQGLELRGPHLVTRCINHSLHTIGNEEVTVLIPVAQIARAQKALPSNGDERFFCRIWIVPVAMKQLRAVIDDLALLARCLLRALNYVYHLLVDNHERSI